MLDDARNKASGSLDKRLELLAKELATRAKLERWATHDQFWAGVNQTLWEFYEYLRKTYSETVVIKFKERLNPEKIAELMKAAVVDLETSYARVSESQDEFLRRVNRYQSKFGAAQTRVAKANNIVAAVSRVTEDEVYEVGDSFNETTLIEDEGLEGDTPMSVFTDGGLATLPRSASSDARIAAVRILDSSNGDENTADERGLEKLYDDNPDTWFEYSRIAEGSASEALTLEFLVSLQTVQVINVIQIDPLILDNKAFPRIIDIETSLDGRNFRSIREGLPPNLTKDEEEELFILGSVGLRNQETAEFVFSPRICQYIKVRLQQGKRVEVDGEKIQRIALREMRFRSQAFDDQGTLTTGTFKLPWLPRRLYLEQRVNDIDPLVLLQWQVSVDGGTEWFNITPEQTLEIGTGASGAVSPRAENASVKLRLTAQRVKDNFGGVARPLAENIRTIIQRVQVSAVPTDIGLQNIPILGSLDVFRPIFAIGQTYGFELSTETAGNNLTLDLPASIEPFSETVKVNGYAWTRVKNFTESQPDDYHYTIDYVNNKLAFGESRTGQFPDGTITMALAAERVLLPDTSPFTVDLQYNHDYNTENTKVTWVDRPRRTDEEVLARAKREHQLSNSPVLPNLVVQEDVPTNTSEFWLTNIPISGATLVFSDKEKFATEVSGVPTIAGEYRITELDAGQKMNPYLVEVAGRTKRIFPGTVTFEARGEIIQPKNSYEEEAWRLAVTTSGLSRMVEVFEPTFSDLGIFSNEKSFVNGTDELETEGDYSIDYTNGILYTAAQTREQGLSTVQYTYQKERELEWEFNDNSSQLVINDDSFLVNRNDRNPVTLVRSDGQKRFVAYKDNRWVDIPVTFVGLRDIERSKGNEIQFQDAGVIIDFEKDDFLRGKVLPEGTTRVRLDNTGIVKNSIRFLHLSNDTDAFNDRLVSTDDSGLPVVEPKPIRDVYGNRLPGIGLDEQTQRDVDEETLVRERNYVDGSTELERGGDYSVDYENGILFTFTPIPAHTIIQYEYTDVRVSYIGTLRLNQTPTGGRVRDYTFNVEELNINVQSVGGRALEGGELLVKYDIVDQLKDDPATIFTYYTPVLMGYTLKARRK